MGLSGSTQHLRVNVRLYNMPFSERLADRVRTALQDRADVVEKKMFGGIAFMIQGSMACGVMGDDLMARLAPDQYAAALGKPHVRVMDFTGRPLKGFVYVEAAGIRTAPQLKKWVDETVTFATSAEQVAKQKKKAAKPKRRVRTP